MRSRGLRKPIDRISLKQRLAKYKVIEQYHFMKIELVTNLKRQATKILADLHKTKEPVLITEHGKPSAYLVDVGHYERMQDRMKILEGYCPR